VKVIKALLISVEFIRTNKAEILGFLEKNWDKKSGCTRRVLWRHARVVQPYGYRVR
jgi:hypothetical protein